MLVDTLLYILIGSLAGFLSGFFGLGGGIIVVPGLIFIYGILKFPPALLVQMAAGTSLAIMIITTIASGYAHHQSQNVAWPVFKKLLPGIIVGVAAGGVLASYMRGAIIQKLFALLLIVIAIRMFLLVKPKPDRKLPGRKGLGGFGFLVGFKSGLFGLGGGILMIPFLTRCHLSMRQAAGVSTICGFSIAVLGTITYALAGLKLDHPLEWSTGYVYWPAFLGVALASVFAAPFGAMASKKVASDQAKRIFSVVLLLVALRLLVH